jgi:hypothetical protein
MIKRPYFQFGAVLQDTTAPPLSDIIPKRMGTGNYQIKRDNFTNSDPKPRNPRFDDFQIAGLEKRGSDKGLGDKTLSELFSVDVPDPSDNLWLAEKQRLTNKYLTQPNPLTPEQIKLELLAHKPLGRDQRKIRKRDNVASSALSFRSKLEEMEQEIREGRAVDSGKLATIEGQLNNILSSTRDISNMTQQQLKESAEMLEALHIPRTHEELGLPRIIGNDYYKLKSGIINMFLLKNAENHAVLSLQKPIFGITNKPTNLSSMVSAMGLPNNNKQFLDLGNRVMLNIQGLINLVNDIPEGFNNPAIGLSENELSIVNSSSGASAETPSQASPPSNTTSPSVISPSLSNEENIIKLERKLEQLSEQILAEREKGNDVKSLDKKYKKTKNQLNKLRQIDNQ